jgi:TP901 family phage tail tape measure protein
MALGDFAGGLGFGLKVFLDDGFSEVADQISGKMGTLGNKADDLASTFTSKLGGLAAGIGIAYSFSAAVSSAAELSDQMVTVSDVTGLSGAKMENLRMQLEGMDTRTSLPDLLDLTTLGSQLGVAEGELLSFTKAADSVGLVLAQDFGGSATQAVEKLAQLSKNFKDMQGLTVEEQILRMGSALDTMGDSAAVNVQQVATFAQRLGELGSLGPTASQAIGLGTAFDELGLKTSGMSSAVSKLFLKMGESDKSMAAFAGQIGITSEEFKQMFAADPNEAMLRLAQSMKGLSNDQMAQTMKTLGLSGAKTASLMQVLGENMDLVRKRQTQASDAMANGNGITDEAQKRNATFAAQLEKVQRNMQVLLTRIGEGIATAFGPLLDIVNFIIKAFSAFAASPFGREVIKYTTLIAGFTIGVFALSYAIGAVKGAMRSLARQAMATMVALGPIALIALPIIGIVMAVQKATSSFAEFNGTVKSGLGGLLQKFGGIIAGVQAIWNSWDSVNQTFSISGDLMDKLNQLGIGQLVVNIGTWVVRIKEFLGGVMSGFSEAFGFVWSIVTQVTKGISKALTAVGINVGKNTSAIEQFGAAGKIVGYIIVGILTAIAVAAAIAAINIIIAFFPVILVIAAIAAGIYVLVTLWQWFIAGLQAAWEFLGTMYSWGAQLVNYLWEGIKSAWKGFTGWLYSSLTSVPIVGPAIKWLFGDTSSAGGDLKASASAKAESPEVKAFQDQSVMQTGAELKGEQTGIMAGNDKKVVVQPQTVNVMLDSDKIGTAVTSYQENQNTRK